MRLQLVYGKPHGAEALKRDAENLDWAIEVQNNVWKFGKSELVWQPAWALTRGEDLIVSEQANRNLINFPLMAGRNSGGPRFAFWGHGRNRQATVNSWRNKVKSLYMNQCDWWFAYTAGVAAELVKHGFPADKITDVRNSIDTKALSNDFATVTEADKAAYLQELGLSPELSDRDSLNICLYCGGMYAEKNIPMLIAAADMIHARVPNFYLLAIGSGTHAYQFDEASKTRPWLRSLGPRFGKEKATCFAISRLFLMPGLVGLAVLDCFVTQTPMATTVYEFHSPEIDYLMDGENGIVTDFDTNAYVEGVIKVLESPETLARLRKGCAESAPMYSMEAMVANFGDGIIQAIDLYKK